MDVNYLALIKIRSGYTETLLPITVPVIEAAMDNTQPVDTYIHIDEIQKFGSTIAEIMPIKLQMTGTYQILRGFCLIIKKQQTAITRSEII